PYMENASDLLLAQPIYIDAVLKEKMQMAVQVLLHFSIAHAWMLVNTSFKALTFVIGYIIGMMTMVIMRLYFIEKLDLYRIWAFSKLNLIVFRELLLFNIDVLKIVLRPKMDIEPSVFAYPTELEHDWEITLLSNLITLTPGTLVLHVSDDQRTLYIHAI